jgi:hypothetical protein
VAPASAVAQGPIDKQTFFTFSQPITLPGVTLPAGTYQFRLADPTGSRQVVQVLSDDGSESYAMLLTIPAQRFDVPAEPEISFMETPSNTPAAVKIWWYPGHTIGREFIYPKEQAMLLAAGPGATTEELKAADVSLGVGDMPVTAEMPPPSERAAAVEREVIASEETPAGDRPVGTTGVLEARAQLPETASLMPILVAIGTLSLLGSVGLRRWRRR